MSRKNFSPRLLPLSFALSLGLISATSLPTLVQAQSSQGVFLSQNGLGGQWNAFEPPNRGLPGGRQEGGGCAWPCPNGSDQITAISPPGNAGLTVNGSPTFYLYVPATISLPMEFKLSEYTEVSGESEKEVYKTTFQLTGKPGVIGVNIPENAALAPGKNYYWSFSLICRDNAPEANIIRGGWIKRTEATAAMQQELSKLPMSERYEVYKQKGMWFDAVSTLAEQRKSNPNDGTLNEEWMTLLDSVELGNLAQAPLLDINTSSQAQNQ